MKLKYSIFLIFTVFSAAYYSLSFDGYDIDKGFLSVSTFLFAIFSGFFIARQGSRYSSIPPSPSPIGQAQAFRRNDRRILGQRHFRYYGGEEVN